MLRVVARKWSPDYGGIDLPLRNIGNDFSAYLIKRFIPDDVGQHSTGAEGLGGRSVLIIERLDADLHLLESRVVEGRNIKLPVGAGHEDVARTKIRIRRQHAAKANRHGD